jgi:energy-coupling factor transport system substrate-specific component
MKPIKSIKSTLTIISIAIYSALVFLIPVLAPRSIFNPQRGLFSLILNIGIYLVLFSLALFFRLQERALNSKEITFIAIYSAFTAIARIPFIVIPNFQPCSYLIFCAGYVFGPLIGFLVGANTAWISNLFMGQGPWTIYQILGWGFIGMSGAIFNRKTDQVLNRWILAFLGFIWGFLYGWLLNLWYWMIFFPPITWETLLLVNLQSFPFDLTHALGNFLFLGFFGERTIRILQRYKQRFHFQIIEIKN